LFNFHVPLRYLKEFRHEDFDIVIDDINKVPFYTPLYVKKPLLGISHHFFGKSIFREAGPAAGTYVYAAEKLIDQVYKSVPFAVVSQSTLDEFVSRGFPKENFRIITNAIDREKFPFRISEKTSFPSIAYFGRLKKYKSIDHLLEAFTLLSPGIPDAKLRIIGGGDYKTALENLAAGLGIADKVKFFGYVSEEDKIKLLSESYCVVNTSVKEGWGITNIESNACGTPVISADVPGLKDSVLPGTSGLLYRYGNIFELKKNLYTILTDNSYRLKLSEGALSWAEQFDWDKSAGLMYDYCKEIIKNSLRKK
jgi:glycosyltransferase involved in cell wall biosynthesis